MRKKDIDRINSIIFSIEQIQKIPHYSIFHSKNNMCIVIYSKDCKKQFILEITFKPMKYTIIIEKNRIIYKRLDGLIKELKRLIK